jgi:hypothetical protein
VIAGFFDSGSPEWPVPMVRLALYLPGVTTTWSLIDFLLDTGAATTCLHAGDVTERLRVSDDRLKNSDAWDYTETYSGVGGGATYYVTRARYALLNERSEWKVMDGLVRVARTSSADAGLPSILGWDVLQNFAVSLDWRQKLVELRE